MVLTEIAANIASAAKLTRKLRCISILGATAMLMAGSVGAGADSSTPITLRVGAINNNPIYWGVFGAQALGYAKEEGVKLDIMTIDEPGCMRGLISDSIDVCLGVFDSVARAAQSGANVRIFATLVDPTINALVVDPKQVTGWSDLKGKAISAQAPGVASSIRIAAVLAEHGVDPASVDFLTVGGTSARYAALVNGTVAGAIVSQPEDVIAVDQGYVKLGSSDSESTTIGTYVSTIPGRSAETDEGVRRLTRAINRAHAWIVDPANIDQAVKVISELNRMDPGVARRVLATLIPTYGKPHIDPAHIERDIRIVKKFGGLNITLPATSFYDESFSK